jgi:hypothetical protein
VLRRVLRIVAVLAVLLVAGGLATVFLARLHDGPLGPFPGGPFAQAPEPAPADWDFLARAPTVELQVGREDRRSVTTWVVLLDGAVYVPSGFAERKTWPHVAEREPRILLRSDGRVFVRRATRVRDPEALRRLSSALQRKYGVGEGAPGTGDETWWFRLDAPAAAAVDAGA